MIKNIVFDFGNVIVKFDVYRILDICSGYHNEHLKEIIRDLKAELDLRKIEEFIYNCQ